jgi:ABC-type proline/glycine betaine transport system ATPase subunit
MNDRTIRAPSTTSIVVMGVAGSGKSTIMRALAARLAWPAAEATSSTSPRASTRCVAGSR